MWPMKKYFLLLALLPFSAFAFRANLTAEELSQLKKGKEVERVEFLKDQVFPRVTLFNIIPHTPKENMDVFTDFENHKNFIPGLKKSKIVKKKGNKTDVFFEMHMPMPVSNSEYTTRHTVTTESNDTILKWDLVKSEQVKDSKGTVMFEEYEGGKSLFTYINHVTPKSSLAWVVKDKVVPEVKENIKVVIKHLDKTVNSKLKK